jgi:acetolactate synthase-1/2/3 large subunit
MEQRRLGGHLLAGQLVELGGELVFAVPGESYLAVLDGLYEHRDRIRLVTTRHEGGAAMMAAGYGKLTGRPGLCMVTRGPGASNASIGVHVASQDGSPLILFIGQVPTAHIGRGAFQEIDYRQMFGGIAKEVIEVRSPDRIAEDAYRAFYSTTVGEPGPVVVVLPEDVTQTPTGAAVVRARKPAVARPSATDIAELTSQLLAAERPLIVLGGSPWSQEAAVAIRDFAEAARIPVATAMRRQDHIDNTSHAYVGSLGMGTTTGLDQCVRQADLIAFVGARPDAVTMNNFSLIGAPQPHQRILHVHPDPAVPGRVYRADLAVIADAADVALHLGRPERDTGSAWLDRLRHNYVQSLTQGSQTLEGSYMSHFNKVVPADSIITVGAGSYTAWAQAHHQYRTYPSQLAPQAGAMGYGLPAAISAKLAMPSRTVVAFAGDGCFLMTGQELATAAQHDVAVIVIVVNNNSYGVIRQHQEREFPDRRIGTTLDNPDFVRLAKSYGAEAERVGTPENFGKALERAVKSRVSYLIEVVDTDREPSRGAAMAQGGW